MALPEIEIDKISAPHFEIPSQFTKSAIREEQQANGGRFMPKLWNDRGKIIEYRGTNILRSRKELIKEVEINTKPDEAGYDSIVYFNDDFIPDGVLVEFKSTSQGVQNYKQKIRDRLPLEKRNIDGVREYMTFYDIVLVNCNDKKSPEEIVEQSFEPQVKRIQQRRLLVDLISLRNQKDQTS
jgi:hypothetical protein